jgi:uncharacterized membrane protein
MTETDKTAALQKYCTLLYGIYGLSVLTLLFDDINIILAGLLAMTIAYILANSKKESAKDTPYASHLRWMNRTFWIGSGVIFPLNLIVTCAFIAAFTDAGAVSAALGGGDPDITLAALQGYLTRYETRIMIITTVTTMPAVIWWVRRCWVGYALLKEDKPVEKVTSWL